MALTRPEVLERLQANADVVVKKLTIEQVERFCAGVIDGESRTDIETACELTTDEVFDLGAALGTWLIHSNRTKPVDLDSLGGIGYDTTDDDNGQLTIFAEAGVNPHVADNSYYPPGFRKAPGQQRDIGSSLGAILFHKPDRKTLLRWLDRHYPTANSVLTARDVFVLWSFARIGRLDDLDKVSNVTGYAKVVLRAWNALETTVETMERAVAVLCDPTSDVEAILDACTKARWVNEARIDRLERTAKVVGRAPHPTLTRALTQFAREVDSQNHWHVTDLGVLHEGQIRRIVEALGLAEDTTRKQDAQLRHRLAELGFTRDLDMLLPIGAKALKVGAEDVFWDAVERRREGDPDWRDQLDEALDAEQTVS